MKEKWIRCLQVEPGKVPEECTLENSLSALQEAVGGLTELLDMEDLGNGVYVTMLCNEEGEDETKHVQSRQVHRQRTDRRLLGHPKAGAVLRKTVHEPRGACAND